MSERSLRILLVAQAPWRPTGYGTPGCLAAEMWRGLGHETMFVAVDEQRTGILEWRGYPVATTDRSDPWGEAVMADLVKYWRADVVINLFDPWVMKRGFLREVTGVPWIGWFPLDQWPPPYHLEQLIHSMDAALVYSEWGLKHLRTIEKAAVMPIPIDVEGFTEGDKTEAKGAFGLPSDCIVVGMIGANIGGDRKAFAEQVEGFCLWAETRKDHARLLINSNPWGAVNIPSMLAYFGCQECGVYLSEFARNYGLSNHRSLATLYQAMDVLLHASAAEGFGMCILEAMACGTPVIINYCTSMPEIAPQAIRVEDQVMAWSPHGGWWQRPTPAGVAHALQEFDRQFRAASLPEPLELRRQAEKFSADNLAPLWRQVFEEVCGA